MKKKKHLLKILLIVILPILGFIIGKNNQKTELYDESDPIPKVSHKNMLSMMLERNAGAGDYSLETSSSWPTNEDGYVFNATLSKCEKGSKLRWDEEDGAVVMVGTTSDKCYVYFDKVFTLTAWIKSQYTGIQGDNNLYYHNGTILGDDGTVLDAGDNSYRYAGASDTTNNFVCFGSDEENCPDDNLYRIIGVFDDQVKLIKWDYATSELLGTNGDYYGTYSSSGWMGTNKGNNSISVIGAYWWNNDDTTYGTNIWNLSKLNTINLNKNFINNIGTKWSNKIASTTWRVGGNTFSNIYSTTAANAYKNEYTNPAESTTVNAKIGLMYASDYGFASETSAWMATLGYYKSYIDDNWMYIGLYEWTIVRKSDTTDNTISIQALGSVSDGYVGYADNIFDGLVANSNSAYAVRPVFYLNSDITYVSGDGTKNSPILIN